FLDYVAQDDKNSAKMAFQLNQGGLGMPNKDYYFKTDSAAVAVRTAYGQYLAATFGQLGADSAAALVKAKAVLQLETRLAGASRARAELSDPNKNYHKMDIAALEKLAPGFD